LEIIFFLFILLLNVISMSLQRPKALIMFIFGNLVTLGLMSSLLLGIYKPEGFRASIACTFAVLAVTFVLTIYNGILTQLKGKWWLLSPTTHTPPSVDWSFQKNNHGSDWWTKVCAFIGASMY
jgi:hypothetical protein